MTRHQSILFSARTVTQLRIEQELRLGDRIPAFVPLSLRIERFGLRQNCYDLSSRQLLCAFDRFSRRLVLKLRVDRLWRCAYEGGLAVFVARQGALELGDFPRTGSGARCCEAKGRGDRDDPQRAAF